MIRPLRRAHRRIVLALAVVVPIVLAFALLRRAEPPLQRDWPFPPSPPGGYDAAGTPR